MICEYCGEEIKKGNDYAIVQFTQHILHEDCVDDYFEEMQENEVSYVVRGEEDND